MLVLGVGECFVQEGRCVVELVSLLLLASLLENLCVSFLIDLDDKLFSFLLTFWQHSLNYKPGQSLIVCSWVQPLKNSCDYQMNTSYPSSPKPTRLPPSTNHPPSLNLNPLSPSNPIKTPSSIPRPLDREALIRRLSGQPAQSFQQLRPSTRQDIRSAKQLNNSNVSIVNQFFNPKSEDGSDTATLRTALERKDLEVEFFRTEMERLREQVRDEEQRAKDMDGCRRREGELQREKGILQDRVVRIEREMEDLQTQLLASKSHISSSSEIEKAGLQKQLAALMKGEIELRNQVHFYKDRASSMEKQIKSLQQVADDFQSYKSQVILEINILTNLNHALSKDNESCKQTANRLEQQIAQMRTELTENKLKGDKQSASSTRELRTIRQELQQKTLQLTLAENQLRSCTTAKSVAELEKQNIAARAQEQIRAALNTVENLKRENATLAGSCEALRKENQNLVRQVRENNFKQQNGENEVWRINKREQERILQIKRQIQDLRDKMHEKDSLINSLKLQLQQKEQQVRTSTNDLVLATASSTSIFKTQLDLESLRSEIQQLKRQNKILEDANRDLRARDHAETHAQNTSTHLLNVKLQDKTRRIAELEMILETQTKQNEQIRQSFRNQQMEAEKLRVWVRDEQQRSNLLQKQSTQTTEQLFTLRRQLEIARNELISTKSQADSTKQLPQRLNRELDRAKLDIDRFKSEGDRYKYELDRCRAQLQQTKRELQNTKQRCKQGAQLTRTVNDLKKSLEHIESSGKLKLQEFQIRYRQEIEHKEHKFQIIKNQKVKLQQKINELQQIIRMKERDLLSMSQIRRQQDDSQRQVQRLKQQLQSLQGQLIRSEEKNREFDKIRQQNQSLYLQTQQIQDIKKKLMALEEKERAFLNIQQGLLQIAKLTYKSDSHVDRQNLFLKVIASFEEIKRQSLESKRFYEEMQSDIQTLQIQNRNLSHEKGHLIKDMQSLVNRLKQIEGQIEYLTNVTKSAEGQAQRLKTLNNNLKTRLQKQISEKQWLQNKLRGGIELIQENLDKTKYERTEVYSKMKQLMDS